MITSLHSTSPPIEDVEQLLADETYQEAAENVLRSTFDRPRTWWKEFCCPKCTQQGYASKQGFRVHWSHCIKRQTFTGVSDAKDQVVGLDCKLCAHVSFPTQRQLALHLSKVHGVLSDAKGGPCPKCGKKVTFQNMNRHLQESCPVNRQLPPDQRLLKFTRPAQSVSQRDSPRQSQDDAIQLSPHMVPASSKNTGRLPTPCLIPDSDPIHLQPRLRLPSSWSKSWSTIDQQLSLQVSQHLPLGTIDTLPVADVLELFHRNGVSLSSRPLSYAA